MPLRRVCRRQQDSRLVPPAFGRRSLLRHDPHGDGSSLGSLLEGSGVPLGADLHLTGYLEEGPYGLLLRSGGGVWELDAKTGLGKETGTTTAVSKCVCVKFVAVAR